MAVVRLLVEREIRRLVTLDAGVIETIRDAFLALSAGGVDMPPILHLQVAQHHGEVDVKTAFVPGVPRLAVKISPGFFDNPARGLPSLSTPVHKFGNV